jgi:hypothetical protein
MAYWTDSSLLAAPQTAFGTVNSTPGDFEALECEAPSVSFATEITELELLTGQVAAAPERLPGRRSGTISFKIPLEGFKAGYDPTSEDPGATGVIPRWLALIGNVLGSANASIVSAATQWAGAHLSNSDYDAAAVTSATTSAITADAASDITTDAVIRAGQLVVTATTAAPTVLQLGFAKSLAGAILSLFEPSKQAVSDNAANFYGSANAWLSTAHATQVPQTMLWVGQNAAFAYILQDCICESFKIDWESGAVPMVEFNYKFYDYQANKTLGGLVVPDDFTRIPQIVGTINGYASLSGALRCGLKNCTLEFTQEIVEIPCHSASQGIGSVAFRKPRVRVGASILHDSADLIYNSAGASVNQGSHVWQAALELGTVLSLGVYVGAAPGRCFAFRVPALRLVEVPAVEVADDGVRYTLVGEASAYSGDSAINGETAANSPLNALLTVAVA